MKIAMIGFATSSRPACCGAATPPSATKFWPGAAFLLLMLALTGCGQRPGTEVLYPHGLTDPALKTVTVYVATTREPAAEPIDGYTRERDDELSYAEFVISIPPDHEPGEIEWAPSPKADPERYFTVVSHTILSPAAFEGRVGGAARRSGKGSAALFVHGFNVSFPEGLFRLAQLAADSNISGVPILFSWPSQARILDYATDKESATFSRDGLTEVLEQVTALSSVRSVLVFGHSMGGWLTMEALRQLSLTGKQKALRKLNVILAAPDIDEDVFASQVETVGPLNPPMMIMVSGDDIALRASRILQGNHQRAGAFDITDPDVVEAARAMNVLLVDISAVSSVDALNHSRYASMAAIYRELDEYDSQIGLRRQPGGQFFASIADAATAR